MTGLFVCSWIGLDSVWWNAVQYFVGQSEWTVEIDLVTNIARKQAEPRRNQTAGRRTDRHNTIFGRYLSTWTR